MTGDTLIGQRFGQYEILSKLGTGGMAAVYRARQLNVDRFVALKVMLDHFANNTELIQRFQAEVKIAASLSHPHIVKVFDYGQHGEMAYIVMELLTGGSLAQLITERGKLPPDLTLRLFNQIAEALDYAHQNSVVHRDLKPANVLLDSSQNAFITDFGIARLINSTSLTRTGMVMGTAAYMAPELWEGARADSRTDIYALGILLYEMLSGQTPYTAETPLQMMYQHVNALPPPLALDPQLSPALNALLNRALAKRRDDRFGSAKALADALRAALEGKSAPASVVPPAPSAAPQEATYPLPTKAAAQTAKRRGNPLWIIGAAAVLIVILAVFILTNNSAQQAAVQATQTYLAALPSPTEISLFVPTETETLTPTPTLTETPTVTPSTTTSPTETPSPTATATLTETPSGTPSPTLTLTATATPTFTPIPSPTEDVAVLVAATLNAYSSQTAQALSVQQTVDAQLADRLNATNTAVRTITLIAEEGATAFAIRSERATITAAAATLNAQSTALQLTVIAAARPTERPTATFVSRTFLIGDRARVFVMDEGLKLRAGPGVQNRIIENLPSGTIVTIIGAPQRVGNLFWWQIRSPSGNEGWSVEAVDGIQTLQRIQ
ncbi:MAG: serine/threonine protein kinase [Chloroflexi bacterium CFX4]|nr:serine/threonine protein kinase [Chloroflexi bacterium CFX4]MDL1923136.1 hypothetical protein [Chloroflexi bacterium CFX3]